MTRKDEKYHENEALMSGLFDALSENQDIDLVQHDLIQSGIDMDKTISDGQALISHFLKRQQLVRGRAWVESVKSALAKLQDGTMGAVDEARDAIARVIAGESAGRGYQVVHRKLESIEKEDLESLKDDAAILELILKLRVADKEQE